MQKRLHGVPVFLALQTGNFLHNNKMFAECAFHRLPIFTRIDDKILTTIDALLENEFTDSTIIMVSHKSRSALKFHKKIHMEEKRIQVETC